MYSMAVKVCKRAYRKGIAVSSMGGDFKRLPLCAVPARCAMAVAGKQIDIFTILKIINPLRMSDCSCTSSSRPVHSVKELEPLAGVFKALGHPVRLMIVEMLLDGERCVCELQKDSGRDMSTVSSHLNVLKNSRIVSCEQRGKNVYYSLCCPCLSSVLSCLQESPALKG